MMKTYITSDLHFGHNKEFLYKERGYSSIIEHDTNIIKKWNRIIKPEDTVYILGDLMLNDNEHGMQCIKQLNGQLKIIRGNHDTDNRWELYKTLSNVELLGWANVIKFPITSKKGITRKYHIYLSHYPTCVVNDDTDKPLHQLMLNLCGHSHTTNPYADIKMHAYHVELDAHNMQPILMESAIGAIKKYFDERNF